MMDLLHLYSERWLELMWRIIWQGGVFIAFVFIITKIFRRLSPTIKHLLWMLVIVKFLLMPFVMVPITIPVQPITVQKPVAEMIAEENVPAIEPEFISESSTTSPTKELPPITQAPSPKILIHWHSMLFSVWVSGIVVLLLGIIYRSLKLKRDISTAKVLEDENILNIVEEGARVLNIKPPLVKISGKFGSPLACSILHPTLIFPEHIIHRFNQSELRAIINHELAHIKRLDILTNWLQIATQAFYFFNPLIWYVNRRIRLEREQACDDWVLQMGKEERKTYADALLKIVEICSKQKSFALGIVGVSEPFTLMAGRLKMIMDKGRKVSTRLSVGAIIGLVVIALVGIPVYAKKEVYLPSPDVSDRWEEKAIKNAVQEMQRGIEEGDVSLIEKNLADDYSYAFLGIDKDGTVKIAAELLKNRDYLSITTEWRKISLVQGVYVADFTQITKWKDIKSGKEKEERKDERFFFKEIGGRMLLVASSLQPEAGSYDEATALFKSEAGQFSLRVPESWFPASVDMGIVKSPLLVISPDLKSCVFGGMIQLPMKISAQDGAKADMAVEAKVSSSHKIHSQGTKSLAGVEGYSIITEFGISKQRRKRMRWYTVMGDHLYFFICDAVPPDKFDKLQVEFEKILSSFTLLEKDTAKLKEKIAKHAAPGTATGSTFVSEMHNCSITAPEGWQFRAATVPNTIVDFSRTDGKKSIVRLFAFESDSDAKTVMGNRDKALPELCQQVEKVGTRQILVSGVKAWETESKYSIANLGEFHEKAVYFANNGKVYMILCQAIAPDKYGEMTKDFDAIIASFKFLRVNHFLKVDASKISITVFPIIMSEKPSKKVSEVIALMLEKAGLKEIDVSEEVFLPSAEDDIWQISESFSTFIRKKSMDTDYALFGEYVGTPQTGVKEVRCIVVDREGKRVWVDRQTPEDDDFKRIDPKNPMLCSVLLVERLRTRLGLSDPLREDKPEGKWATHWDKESGIPPDSELSAMKERRTIMRENFKNAKMLIFPVLVNEEVSKENAVNLAELLNEKKICQADVAPEYPLLKSEPSSNELKVLWDLARKFRSYVKENKIEADYAFYGQYFIDINPKGKECVGAVHFIVCDRYGEWVIVGLQNEYQPDFKSISPKTALDCGRLVVKRLEGYLNEEK